MSLVLNALAANSFALLYISQAATYIAAAILSHRAGHRDLAVCYGASAAVHSAIAAMHAALPVG